jgi:hypothetical protein
MGEDSTDGASFLRELFLSMYAKYEKVGKLLIASYLNNSSLSHNYI